MADLRTPLGKCDEMTDTPGFALLQEVLSIYSLLIEENPRLRREMAALQAERDKLQSELTAVLEREAASTKRWEGKIEAALARVAELKLLAKGKGEQMTPDIAALKATQARIAELEAERAAHHANPADFRYWEGRYRDEKARAEAAEARLANGHPALNCREWLYYPIAMPLTAKDEGPATVGVDAAKMSYEVWDRDLVTHGSFDYLPDAINYAMALNYDVPADLATGVADE